MTVGIDIISSIGVDYITIRYAEAGQPELDLGGMDFFQARGLIGACYDSIKLCDPEIMVRHRGFELVPECDLEVEDEED